MSSTESRIAQLQNILGGTIDVGPAPEDLPFRPFRSVTGPTPDSGFHMVDETWLETTSDDEFAQYLVELRKEWNVRRINHVAGAIRQ